MSYLSFFTPEYKYKQIVNAVCALNASLVLLDTTTAIENRVLCLLGGIAIVLLMHLLEKLAERIKEHFPYFGRLYAVCWRRNRMESRLSTLF